MWGAFACVCTCVCTCVRYLRYHASCFWRVWNLLSSEDWMVSEPLKAPQIHLSPSPSAEITSTLYTSNHFKKQFTQVFVLMSQILCQLRNHPNSMFLCFLADSCPGLFFYTLSDQPSCYLAKMHTSLFTSSWNMFLENTLYTSKYINCRLFWIMTHVLHDGSDCVLQG